MLDTFFPFDIENDDTSPLMMEDGGWLPKLTICVCVSSNKQLSDGGPWSWSLVLPGPNHLKREHQEIDWYGSDVAYSKESVLKDLEPE